jgi:hypothetical protein
MFHTATSFCDEVFAPTNNAAVFASTAVPDAFSALHNLVFATRRSAELMSTVATAEAALLCELSAT